MSILKNKNLYSKYKLDNNLSIKVRANISDTTITDVFGADRRPLSDNIRTRLYGQSICSYGVTTIENYIYKVERINQVDRSIVSPSYKGPTFLKLFKL